MPVHWGRVYWKGVENISHVRVNWRRGNAEEEKYVKPWNLKRLKDPYSSAYKEKSGRDKSLYV